MDRDTLAAQIEKVPFWYHRMPLPFGLVTPGINDCVTTLRHLRLPEDMTGKSVLDLGTRDGFFAFECERRGAHVTAVDYFPKEQTGFPVAASALGSQVRFLQSNLFALNPSDLGTFDVVLMLGLLYHLRDPLGAMDLVRSLCHGKLYLETEGSPPADSSVQEAPILRYCRADSLNRDPTNYFVPNSAAVRAILADNEFEVEHESWIGSRGIFSARAVNDAMAHEKRKLGRPGATWQEEQAAFNRILANR